jgi:hypothetical protein
MKNLQARWLILKIISVVVRIISLPLSFYIGLLFSDKGWCQTFWISLIVLAVIETFNELVSWFVAEQIIKSK